MTFWTVNTDLHGFEKEDKFNQAFSLTSFEWSPASALRLEISTVCYISGHNTIIDFIGDIYLWQYKMSILSGHYNNPKGWWEIRHPSMPHFGILQNNMLWETMPENSVLMHL